MALPDDTRRRMLKKGLEALYRRFDPSMLSPDPLECVPANVPALDREAAAFLAAAFAYGRADLIVRNVRSVLGELGPRVHRAVAEGRHAGRFRDFRYRFHKRPDLVWLLMELRRVYREHGSLENAFCSAPGDTPRRLDSFARLFRKGEKPLPARSFLVPSPVSGSACKRMNLFLRWMVRGKDVDLGLWKKMTPAELIIPLDVHVHRISGRIGLCDPKKAADFKAAALLTERLKEFDAADPVRFDFALCSLGKLGHCAKTPSPSACLKCVLKEVCGISPAR